MFKQQSKRMTINLAKVEKEKLESSVKSTGRNATEIIRSLVRSLEIQEKP